MSDPIDDPHSPENITRSRGRAEAFRALASVARAEGDHSQADDLERAATDIDTYADEREASR